MLAIVGGGDINYYNTFSEISAAVLSEMFIHIPFPGSEEWIWGNYYQTVLGEGGDRATLCGDNVR